MMDLTIEFFTATTADDQRNYFYGTEQSEAHNLPVDGPALPAGTYRVIDGLLCRILSGLPADDIYERLREAAAQPS